MIHKIFVGPETEVQELKKIMRKKLMTGGAVLRLEEGVSIDDLRKIVEVFALDVERHGVQATVLAEVAKRQDLPEDLSQKLHSLGLPEVETVLQSRQE